MDNVTIDIFDLLRRILFRWKFILVCMFIGAVLLDGVGYIRNLSRSRQSPQSDAEEAVAAVEDAKADLSEREIAEVDTFADAYFTILDHYQTDLAYCEDSLKMQLDPNCVPTLTAQFYIDNNGQSEMSTGDVASYYTAYVTSQDVCQEILTFLGWDTDVAYIEELISVDIGTRTNSNTVNVGTNDAANTNVDLSLNTNDTNLLVITVISGEKADCEAMMDIIEQALQEETGELQRTYGNFNLTLLQKLYSEKADEELLSYQETQISGLNTLRTSLNTLQNTFSDDQADYFDSLVTARMTEQEEQETAEEAIAEEDTTVTASPKLFNIKYIILGLFLGLIVACAYLLLRYILASNLRVKDDLEDVYHFPILGCIPSGDKKSLLSGEKKNQFTQEERIEMICAGIRIAAEKADMKSVYLTGTAGDEESKQILDQIMQALTGQIDQIAIGRSVVYDPASLEAMSASDGVVFVERVDYSPYADLQKEAEACQKFSIPVIGAIVIE